MEDDDEFGDLYTDVLRPFESSQSSSAPQPHQPSTAPQPHRPIDLNLRNEEDEILYAAPHSNPSLPHPPNTQTLAPADSVPANSTKDADSAVGSRGLEDKGVELPKVDSVDSNIGGKTVDLMDKDVNFDIEEDNNETDDMGLDPVIPGLSETLPVNDSAVNIGNPEVSRKEGERGEDDWDSDDSEDDLQIVLNDNDHGPMAMERGGIGGNAEGGDDDDDEDGLVIVADGELNQPMEEQEWGEDGAQAAEGERKEMGEAGKAVGGGSVVAPPKVGYSNHGYHPFHSQFKYVRPGAVPMTGPATSSPGGVPGQVRPLVNVGPVAGRGRGDWRPTGLKNATPLQKNFHSGFGMPGWGNNMGGRGFGGGLEFTLPSHKTIFDVDIDGFEEKPWKYPGVDTSDFFNFGLNEESWKDYCKQLEQLRLESTMQSKIRVYESGRTEQEYDPDLPPELAAATGIHDFPAENANPGKSDVGQSDLVKGSARLRPPIPTGRAIQVEGGYGERLPSIDTRPPRIRDSDAIIEIVLQDSLDDDSSAGNGIPEKTENDRPREDFGRSAVGEGDLAQVDSVYFDGFPASYNDRKREPVGRKIPFHDSIPEEEGILPFPPEAPVPYTGSGGETPSYPGGSFGSTFEERGTQGRARDRSPRVTPSRNTRDKKFLDNQKEESVESMDGKRSPQISSPVTNRGAHESSVECRDSDQDEPVLADGSSGMEKEEMATVTVNDELQDGPPKHKKLSSRVEQSADEELDDGEDSKAARSSDNSKARSGSSKDYQKWRDGVEEEVIQGRSTHMGGIKRHLNENEQGFQRKNRDGRQEPDRSHTVVKGREGSYPYRDWDTSSAHPLQLKNDGLHRRKERDNLDGPWQRRDDEPYGRRIRTEETRKRERGDEMGSRHRSKARESERSDKDEHLQSRKQLDNGSYRVYHDKDVGSRPREREGSLKGIDDYHGKRRKDEEYMRRDHIDKEDFVHGHRESASRRKRERDEILDQRKRDDQQRVRDNLDDPHSVRHKDESWLQRERGDRQREREEWHRVKQSHEENIPKRERDEGRASIRGGRGAEDKAWVGHTRAKDESKGSDKEHQYKDTVRHSEPSKRRDRVEEESSNHRGREDVYGRGNQLNNDEKRSGKERSSTRNERADNQKLHDRRPKDNTRKNKESEIADNSTTVTSKRHQEDQSGHSKEMGLKGTRVQGTGEGMFASATCFSSQLQVLLPRGPSKSSPFVFPSYNTRRVTITFRPLSLTLRARRPLCVLSAAAKSNSGSNSSVNKTSKEEEAVEEVEEDLPWIQEKALDLVEFTGSVSQAIPGPRVGTSSLPWILALPLAYAGLTFVVAFVKTVKKFSSPRQKRKRLVNKNAMLCKSIDDLFQSGADQPKPDALNQLVQKTGFGMEDILRKYIRYTLNEKPFNPDVVSNLIQLRKASMFDDSQVAEILNEISRRIVRDKGPVVMDISGYTERGFKRKLAVQALFGKVFYLSELPEFCSRDSSLIVKEIFGVTDEDADKLRIHAISESGDMDSLEKMVDASDSDESG